MKTLATLATALLLASAAVGQTIPMAFTSVAVTSAETTVATFPASDLTSPMWITIDNDGENDLSGFTMKIRAYRDANWVTLLTTGDWASNEAQTLDNGDKQSLIRAVSTTALSSTTSAEDTWALIDFPPCHQIRFTATADDLVGSTTDATINLYVAAPIDR